MNIVLMLVGEDKDFLKQVQNQLVIKDWFPIKSWSSNNPEENYVSSTWFTQNANALAEYEEVDGSFNGTSLLDYTENGELKRVIILTLGRAEKLQKALVKENIAHHIVYLSSPLEKVWEKLLKQDQKAVKKLRDISQELSNPDRKSFLYGGNIDLEIEIDGYSVDEVCTQIEQSLHRLLKKKKGE